MISVTKEGFNVGNKQIDVMLSFQYVAKNQYWNGYQ